MWQPQNPICCHYYFIMGPSTPFFFFGFLTLCVFLHLSLTSLCMSHWCLLVPPFMVLLLYFLLLLLLSLALLLLLPFILLLLSFLSLLLLSLALLLCTASFHLAVTFLPWTVATFLHVVIIASFCIVASCKGQTGQKKVAAVLLILATFKTLGQFDIFPFKPLSPLWMRSTK